jgi:hypothetical protein
MSRTRQVTTTLPSFAMSARSFGAKLASIAATASREHEHCVQGQRVKHPRAKVVKQPVQ